MAGPYRRVRHIAVRWSYPLALGTVGAVLAGCANTPPVTYRYYPARAASTFTITQTVDCSADQTKVTTVNTPQVTTAYTADFSAMPYTLSIKALDGAFSDSDIALKLTDDGRLQSINQSTTGEGETILKSAVTFATAAAAIGGGAPPAPGAVPSALPECTVIKSVGGGKPVTLVYTLVVDWNQTQYPNPVFLASKDGVSKSNDQGLFDSLKGQLPTLSVNIHAASALASAAYYPPSSSDGGVVLLTLQKVASVQVDFLVQGQSIATSYILVPQQATYQLPIPKAAMFGKQNFSLSVGDSGAITSIEYGKNTGAGSAVDVLGAAATAAAPETTAAKAADVQAQADLIAQQQRLARCQAQPAQCQ